MRSIRYAAYVRTLTFGIILTTTLVVDAAEQAKPWQMLGYLPIPNERVPDDYGDGFSQRASVSSKS